MSNIEDKVEKLVKPIIESLGYELYDCIYLKEGKVETFGTTKTILFSNKLSPEEKEIISQIEENEIVEEATIRVSGKVIYVTITFVPATTLVEGQSIALASLDYFSEETLNFYDLEYMIQAEDTEDAEGFQLIGAKNVSGTGGIVWNNNTPFEEEEEEVSEE